MDDTQKLTDVASWRDKDAFEALRELLDMLKNDGIKPLHIVLNVSNDIIVDFASSFTETTVVNVVEGLPCSYLMLGLTDVICIILTNDPLHAPALLEPVTDISSYLANSDGSQYVQ